MLENNSLLEITYFPHRPRDETAKREILRKKKALEPIIKKEEISISLSFSPSSHNPLNAACVVDALGIGVFS